MPISAYHHPGQDRYTDNADNACVPEYTCHPARGNVQNMKRICGCGQFSNGLLRHRRINSQRQDTVEQIICRCDPVEHLANLCFLPVRSCAYGLTCSRNSQFAAKIDLYAVRVFVKYNDDFIYKCLKSVNNLWKKCCSHKSGVGWLTLQAISKLQAMADLDKIIPVNIEQQFRPRTSITRCRSSLPGPFRM